MNDEKSNIENAASELNGRKSTKRPRSDTAVRRLTPEQRAKVDAWLFDEQLPYRAVAARCLQELGIKLSTAGLCRYFRQELPHRNRPQPSGSAGYLTLLEKLNDAALRAAEHIELDNDPRRLAEFARILVAARNEASHALRACTTRQKFEFDAATACLIHQVKMQCIAADESLDDCQRILKIREELFGPNLPA